MYRLIFTLIFSFTVFGLTHAQTAPKTEILPRQAFLDSINQPDIQLADIRTPKEHAQEGSFSNAENLDFVKGENFYKAMEENFDKSKPLYIHCKGGIKSNIATKKLMQMGFEEVYELEGGFDNWIEEQQQELRKDK